MINIFSKEPKIFIDILRNNKEKSINELIEVLISSLFCSTEIKEKRIRIDTITRNQTNKYNTICIGENY